jgi:hypothetical protein
MNNFFIEIPTFQYPKDRLLAFQETIQGWKPNMHYNQKNVDTIAEHKWFDFYPDQEDPLIEEVSNCINLPLNTGAYKFVKTLKGGTLPFHVDPNRECVLMLPLTENNAALQWKNMKGQVCCEHEYKYPTVINAKIPHGVPSNNKDRIFLQVTIPCTWKYLNENYKTIFKVI